MVYEKRESFAARIRKYKANMLIFENKVDKLKTDVRMLERRVMKAELRDMQLTRILKSILELSKLPRKATFEDICALIDNYVREHKETEESSFDMIIEQGESK